MNRRSILKSIAALALTPFARISSAASEAKLLLDRPAKFFQFVWATPQGRLLGKIFPSFKKALQSPPFKGARHRLWTDLGDSEIPDASVCSIPIYYDWPFHDQVFGKLSSQASDWPGNHPLVEVDELGFPKNIPDWVTENSLKKEKNEVWDKEDQFAKGLLALTKKV